ncbi:hypothetical protein DE146DRAFT_126577 [Phaeosphaeria sp. MPI-PUGE-AT-0046c]|nr:hypothetical protein DE146DRAFT_126577 [Phaeosphaeria sp. MPI-PUGE-AT-0046c]
MNCGLLRTSTSLHPAAYLTPVQDHISHVVACQTCQSVPPHAPARILPVLHRIKTDRGARHLFPNTRDRHGPVPGSGAPLLHVQSCHSERGPPRTINLQPRFAQNKADPESVHFLDASSWCIFDYSVWTRQCIGASGPVPQVAAAARWCNIYNHIFLPAPISQAPALAVPPTTSSTYECSQLMMVSWLTTPIAASSMASKHHLLCRAIERNATSCHSAGLWETVADVRNSAAMMQASSDG